MTLKQQFEKLSGHPIPLKPKLEDIPCVETSDPARLCKNPVVSVRMTTFNHAPYIRQAVESVMMQETDFEYELIIGEDASPDNTREICFELQKKYPDRIRVLWSSENVNGIGGNSLRILGRCRGEFLAFLEGDDYWMDSHRLQKQVDAMRKHPNVVLCFGEQQNLDQATGRTSSHNAFRRQWPIPGVIPGDVFAGSDCLAAPFTSLIRKSAFDQVCKRYEIFDWILGVGDLQPPRALCQVGDIYLFHDVFATYRNHAGGVTKRLPTRVQMGAGIVRMYFAAKSDRGRLDAFMVGLCESIRSRFLDIALMGSFADRRRTIATVLEQGLGRCGAEVYVGFVGVWLARLGWAKTLSLYFRAIDKMRRILI